MSKTPYKIAHILPWPTIGGVEVATLRISQAVEGESFRSTAFCLSGAAPVKSMFEAEGFATADFEPEQPSYRHPRNYLRASLRLSREFKRQGINLVHCADMNAAFYTALAGRLAGLPVISHVRNRFADISRRDQSFLRAVNKFVFVSQDTWRHFGYKVSPRRGAVVYDGIDIPTVGDDDAEANQSVRHEFDIPDSARIIGMVARVAPQKDYITLAKAAARIVAAEPNVRFLIVGDHSGTENYREHYAEVLRVLDAYAVTPHFVFTDFRRDVPRMIRAMDIFVLCTHVEGLPLVLLEAMAQGKPVVATAVDGIPEIVLDDQTGLLHGHEDEAHLAAQLLSLIQDAERAARLGAAGRRFVQGSFSKERFALNMANLYRGILSLPPQIPAEAFTPKPHAYRQEGG